MLWLSDNNSSLGKCQIKFRSNWIECCGSDWSIVWATHPEDLNSWTYPKDSSSSFGSRLFLATKVMWYVKGIVLLTKPKRVVFFCTVNNDLSLFSLACIMVSDQKDYSRHQKILEFACVLKRTTFSSVCNLKIIHILSVFIIT